MKKLLSALLVLAIMVMGAAALAEGDGYELALVTDVGNIDDQSFNQSSYEGMGAYAEANGLTYAYYRPSEDSTDARVESMRAAIENGAKVVVCPGYLFEDSVYLVQDEYPEVNFLLLDGEPHSADYSEYKTAANTHCILYREEQAGFFAGYAAVKEGYTELGFVGGMAVPAVIRFGYGFVQGADVAAQELGIDVNVKYWYADSFSPSDDIKTKAASWYTEGTQVIFSCGGGICTSIIAAAEEGGGKVIGVDSDQYYLSDVVITSAMKDLPNSVQLSLGALYDNGGVWPEDYAGATQTLGAAENCVGLPTADHSWRFENYTIDEYNELYARVQSGEIEISNSTDAMPETVNVTVDDQT